MPNEPPVNDARQLWQNQPTEPLQMSLEEIYRKAQKFQSRIRARNLREYIAAAIVIVFFAVNFAKTNILFAKIGFGLILAGVLYLVYHLYTKGSARTVPADQRAASYLEFYRGELERQRDLLRNVWRWYLGPVLPGFVVFVIGTAIMHPTAWIFTYAALSALFFVWVAKWNRRKARDLQRQIDELDALRKES